MGSSLSILDSLSSTGADAGLGIEKLINTLVCNVGSSAIQGVGDALSD